MAFSHDEIRAIRTALSREPDWKQERIMASVDAFCDWLRVVLPWIARRTWDDLNDFFGDGPCQVN